MSNLVYYDVTRLVHRGKFSTPTGIDRVDINYIHYFLNHDNFTVYLLFQNNSVFYCLDSKVFFEELYKKWILSESSDFDFQSYLGRCLKLKRNAKVEKIGNHSITPPSCIDNSLLKVAMNNINARSIYINTSHHGIGNCEAYQFFKVVCRAKIVFYLHDIIPIDWPEYVREGDDLNHVKRVKAISECADLVLVNSEYTKSRFKEFIENNRWRVPEVSTMTIGVEEGFFDKIKKENIKNPYAGEKYFVYVSTIEPRKNHLLLLYIWRDLILHKKTKKMPKLILVGKRGWKNENVVDILDKSIVLKNSVVELNNISDDLLISIMEGATAVLYPSFDEGWGMPIVEAIAMNVPVICSDIRAHRESGQGLVKYINPIDSKRWEEEIEAACTDNKYKEKAIAKYEEYEFPTWSAHFNKLENLLTKLVNTGRSEPNSCRLDLISNLCKPKLETGQPQKQRDESLNWADKLINRVFAKNLTDRKKRLLRKFVRDPVSFFCDSKISLFNAFGKFLKSLE